MLTTHIKKLRDCPILIAEWEAFRHAIIAAIRMECSEVCINSNSQIAVNAVYRKMTVLKDIINLVEDIRWLCSYFKDFVLEYCYRNTNRKLMS